MFLIDLGLGHQGELVSVRPTYAYDQLLLPKLAIYASPDNLERMKNNLYQTKDEEKPSSIHALQVLNILSYFINLNKNFKKKMQFIFFLDNKVFKKNGC